jgi:D-3-phosphoglycerate dehydrogenase / 2-oxoglutarate reductase
MSRFRILITDGLDQAGQSILRAEAEVEDRNGISVDDLGRAISEYDALIIRGRTRVTPALLESAPRLRVIGRAGVGVDNIDLEAARNRSVVVVNSPTATTVAVAELTFGLLLALAREIPRADVSMKQGRWLKKELEGVELSGKTLGIIGYGRIGIEMGKRAAAFGMNVVAYDPFVQESEIRAGGADSVSLQDLFAWSDYISLHLPYDVHSRDLIGPMAIAQMKTGVRIVCAARGGILDEAALLSALKSGKVAGAALDVFSEEPPDSGELVAHPRVIATPHIGAQTIEAQSRAAEDIAHEVLAALRGEPLRWKVA